MSERKVYWHPSGPTLKGQPKCPAGQIWSHSKDGCIAAYLAVKDTGERLKKLKGLNGGQPA